MPYSRRWLDYSAQRIEPPDLPTAPTLGPSAIISPYAVEEALQAITGDLAATEAQDTASFDGLGAFAGTLAGTEGQDSATLAASAAATGTIAATDAADSGTFSGTVSDPAITGTLAVTEPSDAAEIGAALLFIGQFGATEATQDDASISGAMVAAGTLAATDTTDAFEGLSSQLAAGTIDASETQDAAAFSLEGLVNEFIGELAATEPQDSADFAGYTPAVEPITILTGSSRAVPSDEPSVIIGRLEAREAPDRATFTGSVGTSGIIRIAERQDTASTTVVSIAAARLAITEASDEAGMHGGRVGLSDREKQLLLLIADAA